MASVTIKSFMKVLDIPKSGKRGNTVWQRNRYGQYGYPAFIPYNPRTTAQVAVRGTFGAVSARWRELTEEQRILWDQVARTKKFCPLPSISSFCLPVLRSDTAEGGLPSAFSPQSRLIFDSLGQSALQACCKRVAWEVLGIHSGRRMNKSMRRSGISTMAWRADLAVS